MNEPAFDPYYKWLGIPPDARPLNYYMLLGVRPFESDVDVICNAADQKMMYVRSFSVGAHAVTSQQILNQISQAKICLCDDNRRAAYDQQLRDSQRATLLEPGTPKAIPVAAATTVPSAAQPEPSGSPAPDFSVASGRTQRKVKRGLPGWMVALFVFVPLLGALFFLVQRHKSIGDETRVAAKSPVNESESTPASTPANANVPPKEETPIAGALNQSSESKDSQAPARPAEPPAPRERGSIAGSAKRMETPVERSAPPSGFSARPRTETPPAESVVRDVPPAADPPPPEASEPPEELLTKSLTKTGKEALDFAYEKLLAREKFDEAQTYFDSRSRSGDEQATRIGNLLKGLENSHGGFWREIGNVTNHLSGGTDLVAANGSVASVVEASASKLVLYVKGKKHRYGTRSDGVFCGEKGVPMSYPLAFLIAAENRQPSAQAHRDVTFFKSLMKEAAGPSGRGTPERWTRLAKLWHVSRLVDPSELVPKDSEMAGSVSRGSAPRGGHDKEKKTSDEEASRKNIVRCKFDFSSRDERGRPLPCLSDYDRADGVPDDVHHAKIVGFSEGVLEDGFPLKERDSILEFDDDWAVFSKDRLMRLKLVMKRDSNQRIVIESSGEYRTIKGRTRYFPLSVEDVGEKKDKTDRAGLSNMNDRKKKMNMVEAYQKQLKATQKKVPKNTSQQAAKANAIGALMDRIKSASGSIHSLEKMIQTGLDQSNSFKAIIEAAEDLEKHGYVEIEWVSESDAESAAE